MRGILIFGLVTFTAGCGDKAAAPRPAGGPTTSGVATGWKDFDGGSFKVTFPWGNPTHRPFFHGNAPAGVSDDATNYSAEKMDKDGITHNFGIVVVRTARKSGPEAVDAVLATAVPPKMKRSGPTAVTWAGQPAEEFKYEPEDGGPTRLVIRRLVTDSTVYLGVVRDRGDLTPVDVARFFDSFRLHGAAKK
jgi:hypothetical protein